MKQTCEIPSIKICLSAVALHGKHGVDHVTATDLTWSCKAGDTLMTWCAWLWCSLHSHARQSVKSHYPVLLHSWGDQGYNIKHGDPVPCTVWWLVSLYWPIIVSLILSMFELQNGSQEFTNIDHKGFINHNHHWPCLCLDPFTKVPLKVLKSWKYVYSSDCTFQNETQTLKWIGA